MRRLLLAVTACLVLAGSLVSRAAEAPDVATGVFHGCGLEGSAKADRVKALNELKNRSSAPARINHAISAADILAPGDDRDRFSTDDAVTITVYVVDVKPGEAESVNCGATNVAYKDTHIAWTLNAHDHGLPAVAEVTPRWRAAMAKVGVDWSTAALKRTLIGHVVEITGYVFNDDEHLQNATNTNPHGTNLWRRTVVEIHPITAVRLID